MLAVAGGGIAIFWPGAFIFGFPGVMASLWMENFQAGRGAIGTTLFFVLAAVGIFMFFVGRWQERFGVRKMVTVGAIMCGLDVFLIAHASNLFMLYLWAFIMGLGSCFIYLPALTSVQKWFPGHRGLVSGIVNLLFGISGAVMAPIFRYMHETMGYVPMITTIGIIALLIGTIAAQFTEAPESKEEDKELMTVKPASTSNLEGPSLTVRESLRTQAFWFLWVTWALQGAAGISMVTLSTAFGLHRGFGLESAVIILTAFNLTNGLSRLVSGILSDYLGRNLTMSATFFAAAISYLLLPHMSDLTILAVLAAVIGFAFGTLFAVSAPLATECFGMTHFGAIFGLIFTAYGFVAALLGPSLSGHLLDLTNGGFGWVFLYLGAFCLISSVLIWFVVPSPRQA
jgi:MFS transporter, OFA family, oxalate/formate antiporter